MSAGFTEAGVLPDDAVAEMLAHRQALTQAVPDESDVQIMLNAESVDSVQIPSDARALIEGASVSMSLSSATVSLDSDTVDALPSGGLELSIGEDVLNRINVNKVKDPVVLDIDLSVGGTNVSQIGGNVTVTLGYEIPAGHSSDDVRAWYVDDKGTMVPVTCEYMDGNAILTLEHLSTYAIGIETGWTQDSLNNISYIAIGIVAALCVALIAILARRRS
jgi:hypothetical protein